MTCDRSQTENKNTHTNLPDTLKFAIIGDYGVDDINELEVSELIKSHDVDFIITCGDNNYPIGADSTIDRNIGKYFHDYIFPYSGSYGSGADSNRFFPSPGNHDFLTANAQPYIDYFALPNNERYYDFIKGPVHFFAMNSDVNEPDGTSATSIQALWLQNKLSGSDAKYKIVYFHHSPYSSSLHGNETRMQWPFKDWGADIVFTGHDHSYERLLLDSLPYIVNGLGGRSFYNFNTPLPESIVRYNAEHGAIIAVATVGEISFNFIAVSGDTIDTYTEILD